jgi:hypothetical protein
MPNWEQLACYRDKDSLILQVKDKVAITAMILDLSKP